MKILDNEYILLRVGNVRKRKTNLVKLNNRTGLTICVPHFNLKVCTEVWDWFYETWLYKIIRIHQLNKKWDEMEEVYHDICNDPMNGCSGDFADDYGSKSNTMYLTIEDLKSELPNWINKIYDWKNPLNPIICKIAGHKMDWEDIGDVCSGPYLVGECKRCGHVDNGHEGDC